MIASINPTTGQELWRFEETSPEEVERALDRAHAGFAKWRRVPLAERAQAMHRAAGWLDAHLEACAREITLEMGKTIVEARGEVKKCAWNCRFYADNAARFLADQPHPSGAAESYVAFHPLGPVLAIMPWNFPFWQLFRFAAPALMAGNVALLKHASNVPACARSIERAFTESGFPEGAFANLYISGNRAEALIDDPRIVAVTLTGSEAVGARVGRRAGAALKKAVLELGESDPFIVLSDADVAEAAKVAVKARFQNAGQSCIAAKRFIIERSIHEQFITAFVAGAKALKVGDPLNEETQMGPLAREDLRAALHDQVLRSVALGGNVLCGGEPMEGAGWFYPTTVIATVNDTDPVSLPVSLPVFVEETFGPVAAVTIAESVEHAMSLGNRTPYGLGANLWTKDIAKARALASTVEAGNLFINGMVASDPRLPFGGVKKSGYGRELSELGIREFTNIQTVWIGPAGA